MIVFKLSMKNIKKSFKDYAIYFLTLVLGVAIFYMFNSLDSQQAMLRISDSTREIIKLMITILEYVSVFVAVVLGLLIVYANNFLINRRKKEFGIYMTLGMGKKQISKIILLETILVGIISLFVGLAIGVFVSQFMSIFVSKMFEADMSEFRFVFSESACIKTCIYFAVMYVAVMLFNTFTVSRYKLINLLNANKKNEKVKIKNPFLSILIFILACVLLARAYLLVTTGVTEIDSKMKLIITIVMGCIGTVALFWSLSGFLLKIVQMKKSTYLKGTNIFVLRQLNNKINTTVVSMSVICIMLFMTISILSSCLSLKSSMKKELAEVTPVDLNLFLQDNDEKIEDILAGNGLDMNVLKDIVEFPIYNDENLTWKVFFEGSTNYYSSLDYDVREDIVKISDYNKIAELYGNKQYKLNDDEFIVLCEYESMRETRDEAMSVGKTLEIAGKEYKSKYASCQDGFIEMSTSHTNTGIILVPDSCNLINDMKIQQFLACNYNAETDEEKQEIEKIFIDSEFMQNLLDNEIYIDGMSKISLVESSVGLATIITFVAIYLGVVFLIASSAILALKQLTESSDNKQRYSILRKIGCDEKMINSALFKQIGIFFALPLILAIIHSIFGIKFILTIFDTFTKSSELLPSIIGTAVIIWAIYGAYFMATYFGSKNIIKEED